MIFKYLARQARRPFGFIGKSVMGRLFNRGNDRLIRLALEALDPNGSDVVLDVGFGGARSFELLTDEKGIKYIHGVDFSPAMVAGARRRFQSLIESGRLQVYYADAANMPLPDDSVDKVLSANTIYFWEDLEAVLSEIHRVLRPGGRLVLAFRSPESLNHLKLTEHGFVKRTAEEVVTDTQAAGFGACTTAHHDKDRSLDTIIVAAEA